MGIKGLLFTATLLLGGWPIGRSTATLNSQGDITNNIWVVVSNSVHRLSDNGKIIATYSNLHLGSPSSIDYSDPFRIMVFYQQQQQVLLINNDGVAIGKPIDLNELGVGEVWLTCRSARGGMWLYHREGHELQLTNPQATRIEQRISLPQNRSDDYPNMVTERNGIIYLGVNNKYIERVDGYGATIDPIDLRYENWFWVDDSNLWTYREGYIEKRQLTNLNIEPEIFSCPRNSSPLVISSKPMCYINKVLLPCEKLNH